MLHNVNTSNPATAPGFSLLHDLIIRRTIGDVRAWTIDAARNEANRLRVTLDGGTDPRELERDKLAAKAAKEVEAAARTVTVADVWPRYMVGPAKPRKPA